MKNITRKTLTKSIRQLIQAGDGASSSSARDICIFGRKITRFEAALSAYYNFKETSELIRKNKNNGFPKRWLPVLKRMQNRAIAYLSDEYMQAVNIADTNKIMEIANSVRFISSFKNGFQSAMDPERAALLMLKDEYLQGARPLKIREIADLVAQLTCRTDRQDLLAIPADGFSALRRKCKEIGLPIAPSRKIRRK